MSKLLLKGGTILVHGGDGKVTPIIADLLVEGSIIAEISPIITAPDGCEVIDCTHKIVSPGFVDAHHHLWESALKGSVEDLTAVPYFATMFTASKTLTPKDIYWSNLAGSLEALEAGTTCVLDFAHANWTEDHSMQALAGTVTSGIRAIHAFAPSVTLQSTSPQFELGELVPNWFLSAFEKMVKSTLSRESRVQMGFGFDFYFMPQNFVVELFEKVRALGVDIITSHWAKTNTWSGPALPAMLKSYGLLDHRLIFSHMGGMTKADAELLRDARSSVVASPSTEMTMGLGPPACFNPDVDIDSVCSIGVDCHCATSASMINEARIGLFAARGRDGEGKLGQGTFSACATALDAFNMITVGGAKALNMEDQIGSIEVGKKADLVIFETQSPGMCPMLDPVTAIVMHSSIGDIDTVIVDGNVKKRNGRLTHVREVEWFHNDLVATERSISWVQIVPKLLEMQKRFAADLAKYDMQRLSMFVENLYGM